MSEKLRRPETPAEQEAVLELLEDMLYHPYHIHDRLSVVEMRVKVDEFLCGMRGEHLGASARGGRMEQ